MVSAAQACRPALRNTLPVLGLLIVLAGCASPPTAPSAPTAATAPTATAAPAPAAKTAHPVARDPAVQAAMARISAERIERRVRVLAGFGTRHTESDTVSDTRGIGAARRWIARELQACSAAAGGRLQVAFDEHLLPPGGRIKQPTALVNVVATLPGSDALARERILVVSGHYDSRASDVMDAVSDAPGANDDASGTAVAMELACAMAADSWPATLVFMAVAGEEQGLLGAERWAEQARKQGLRIEAMITNDIVGSPVGDAGQRDDMQLRLFADGLSPLLQALGAPPGPGASAEQTAAWERNRQRITQQLRAGGGNDFPTDDLGRHLKAAGEAALPGFRVNLVQRMDRYLRGGDHIPFLLRGFAAVRFTEPFENFAHQHQDVRVQDGKRYGDLPEHVDFAYVAKVARVNLAGLAGLALAPAAPANVRLETTELTNDTTLRWDASSDPAVAGYRVVWRETSSAVWQQQRDVGRVQRVTLPVSKDNVVFGVQAVSAGGHASLASFPLPAGR